MEHGGIFHRNAGQGDSRAVGQIDHGVRPDRRVVGVEGGPPGRALAVHDAASIDGDIGQVGTGKKIVGGWKGSHRRHPQDGASGKLEGHVAFQGHGPAEKGSRRHQNCPAASHRVDGGLDGGGVVGASRGGVIGSARDGQGLGEKVDG
jgi:hypothetical protein